MFSIVAVHFRRRPDIGMGIQAPYSVNCGLVADTWLGNRQEGWIEEMNQTAMSSRTYIASDYEVRSLLHR